MYCDFAMLKWPLSVALAIVCGFISNKSEIFMVIYPIPATCLYSVLCRVAGISTVAFTSIYSKWSDDLLNNIIYSKFSTLHDVKR